MPEQTHPETGVVQEAPSDIDRVMGVLSQSEDPEKKPPPDTPEQSAQEQPQGPVEVTPDDLPDETPVQPAADAFELEIVHDGRQVKLNREETIKLARQGYDYTQKTQAVAAKDRQVTEHLQRLVQINDQVAPQLTGQLAQVKALEAQLQQYQGVNWVQEASTDPGRYAQLRAQYDVLRDAYGQAVNQYQRLDGAVKQQVTAIHAQRLQAEAQRLPELIPEWKDPAKLEAAKADISKHFASTYGVDPQELNAKADTALTVAVLYKAMRYDQLVRSKADKSKTLNAAPPMTRPGTVQTQGSAKADKDRELSQRLSKTGDLKDAAALIFNRMK